MDFNTVVLLLLILALFGLGIANIIEAKNKQNKQIGRAYFGFFYIIMGGGLIAYKMTNP